MIARAKRVAEWRRWGWLPLLVLLTACTTGKPPVEERAFSVSPPPRLMIVSWDGAGDVIVDRLLAEGHLPHLAALAKRGVAAEYSVAGLPSKTAVGHAVLWTGCGAACNGVTANSTPLFPSAEHTLLERRRGFSSEALTAEPLYVTAARAGRQVTVLSATQSYPPTVHVQSVRDAGVAEGAYRSVSGFENVIARSRVLDLGAFAPADPAWEAPEGSLETVLEIGESVFHLLLRRDPARLADGLAQALVCPASRACDDPAMLEPRGADVDALDAWSPGFSVRSGEQSGFTFFRLFELAQDGSKVHLYQRGVHHLDGAMAPGELEAYRQVYQGFHDGQFRLYETGALGPPLMLGGDGEAEERVLELTAFDVEQSRRATRWAIERWNPELLFQYLPMSDGAGHTWYGVFDAASPNHDPAVAEELWPYYARVFGLLDGWLGSVLEALPPDTVVVVTSDHGMAGVTQNLLVNAVLEQAGLLARSQSGESGRAAIDLSGTQVLAAEFGDAFFLKVNDTAWKEGIVEPEDREAVLESAAEALLEVRDPATGVAPVTRVFRPEDEPELEGGGPRGGDLYFELAPGYYPRRGLSEEGALFEATRLPWGEGQHGYPPRRREMHAIFYAAGPGLRQGAEIGPIRHVDVAPTTAALLGIPAPPQATGRVVSEALSRELSRELRAAQESPR